MNTATETCRKVGYICTIGWGMLFILNMITYLWTKNSISLFLAGVMLGGFFVFLITLPHEYRCHRRIDKLYKSWGNSLKREHKLLNNLELLKMVKGGKKHGRKKRINKAME